MKIGRLQTSFIALALLILLGLISKVPTFESVKKSYRPSDVWIVDRNKIPLESIRQNNQGRSLDWMAWSEVSQNFKQLVVQVEDQRFYQHFGIDILALGKAFWDKVSKNSNRGASTISMQLVGLLEKDKGRRSVLQKIRQIFKALRLNISWSKEQILEAYINLLPFRGELVGLHAASLGYFNKNPSGLLLEEAAILVALIRSPNSDPNLVSKRACLILKKTDCLQVQSMADQILTRPYQIARSRKRLPVLSNLFIQKDTDSSLIKTSLDFYIQQAALQSLQEQLRLLKNQNVNDGAVLVMETQTGKVLAYVANAGAMLTKYTQVDGIQMKRQAGSTIKPFVYATAFDWKLLFPNSLLEDVPLDISISAGKVYHPKNYDYTFRGMVSVSEALASSLNVPAVKTLQLVGESNILDKLNALGMQGLETDDYYGPSLALGSLDLSLWELTNAYRQFALEGSVFSDISRQYIFDILSSAEYRRFTFGMNSVLSLPFAAAVKTGTSKDMRDNWCIGWTPQYTVGVWVGNFDGKPMWNVSGVSGAAPIWRQMMIALHPNAQTKITKYQLPAVPLPKKTISKIRYPVKDMVVGLDPDIPLNIQKLPIEIENPQDYLKLYINNHFFGKAPNTTLWSLKRGKFVLEMKNPKGQTLDSIKFEVR